MLIDAVRLLVLRARTRGRLRAAPSVRLARGVRITVAPGAAVRLGPGAALGPEARIDALAGTVRIGAGARLGERAVIVAHSGVDVGDRAVIGDWSALTDAAPAFADPETPVRAQSRRHAPIAVGAGVSLGPHVAIGPGVTVPAGATIPAYAVLPRTAMPGCGSALAKFASAERRPRG